MAVYDFANYKEFVNHVLQETKSKKLTRKGLSEALRCQPSHVSAVLSGTAHFSSEQAERVAHFLMLGKDQTEYFLLLLHYNRAGTKELKSLYERMLVGLREKTTPLRNTLNINDELSDAAKAIYYSSWVYAAVHVMISVKSMTNPVVIAANLDLTLAHVESILEFLVRCGLAEKVSPLHFKQKRPLLHLDRSSSFIARHHSIWRLKAMQKIEQTQESNLHYSGVMSLSEADVVRIRRLLGETLKNSIDIVRDSKEETVSALCLDFFKL